LIPTNLGNFTVYHPRHSSIARLQKVYSHIAGFTIVMRAQYWVRKLNFGDAEPTGTDKDYNWITPQGCMSKQFHARSLKID
jgi:hypothetical protein